MHRPRTVSYRRIATLVFAIACALASASSIASAQAQAEPTATATPATIETLPQAGIVPPTLTLNVTGSPLSANAMFAQIRSALDREIRPTLRPGASIAIGAIAPWPLVPLASGARTTVSVNVRIASDITSMPVTATTTISLYNIALVPAPPTVLFLSDDPEYLQGEGLVFQGAVTPERPARLYYYHSVIGVPRGLDIVLTAKSAARVHVIGSEAGPDLDVMSVGHAVTRDLLDLRRNVEGAIVDVLPGKPVIVRHALLLQGEVAAGAVDLHVVSGEVAVAVIASPAGGNPATYLAGPRLPFDGHNRHGTFDLAAFGDLEATFSAGGPNASVRYGERARTPRNLDPADPGRDLGDYGVLHRITFTLLNPTDVARTIYLYQKPLGGPVRSTFIVDGTMHELGCMRISQPYWVATYSLPPQSKSASTTMTMTDGGSFYPVEYGVTEIPPTPYVPPVGTADGCSPTGVAAR